MVPSQALRGSTVTVERGGARSTQRVQTGVVGDSMTQVVSGLEEGDTVVVTSTSVRGDGGAAQQQQPARGGFGGAAARASAAAAGGGFGGGGPPPGRDRETPVIELRDVTRDVSR